MNDRILIVLLLIAASALAGQAFKDEKVSKSRLRRCARQFNIAMNYQCRSVTPEMCEPIRALYSFDVPLDNEERERLIERKCCERRCSLQILRTFCCLM
ncbi:hypothetical protein Q1695_000832 [Nippostrongylus brasiliensis]|nr:hypothetical protein Q1695_000832 [Nippostrongylus brasiliensis]